MKIRGFLALLAFGVAFAASVDAAPLSVYGSLPGFEMASLSQSGDRVAIIGEVKGERRLLILEDGSRLLSSFGLGDIKVRGLYWAGDDTVLVYKSDTSGLSPLDFTTDKAELFSMLVVPLDGKKPWGVFAGDRFITGGVRGFYGVRRKNGRYFGYFGGMTLEGPSASDSYLSNTNPVLYEVDLESHKPHKIAPSIGEKNHRDWIIGPNGEVGATLDFNSGKGDWTIRNGDGKVIASGVNPTGGISLVGLGTVPHTLIYDVTDEDGNKHWVELPEGGGEGRKILEDVGIRGTVFDERNQQLIGYIGQGDGPVYKFFDARWQKVMDGTLKAFPGKTVTLRDWNNDFSRLIVTTDGAGDPGTWWLVDIKTGKAASLGITYTLRPEDVCPVRMVRYKAGDGLEIAAVLTLPVGVPEKNLPVVVLPHGGPGARDYPEFYWWAQAFASRGYAVLQPNFRGSTGYGAAFEQAGHGEWGRKMQSDISDGLAFLVQQGIADPKRACIVGGSYGGYAALAGVTLQKGIYRCAAAVAGISDLTKMVNTDIYTSGTDATLVRVLKEEVGSGRDLRAVSPIRFADTADAPILLVHGKDDTVVNYDQSAAMAKALQAAGKPVELVTLAGEDHWLSRSETRLAMLRAVVDFVEKYNPPDANR